MRPSRRNSKVWAQIFNGSHPDTTIQNEKKGRGSPGAVGIRRHTLALAPMLPVLLSAVAGILAGSRTGVSPWVWLGGVGLPVVMRLTCFKSGNVRALSCLSLLCLAVFALGLCRMSGICAPHDGDCHVTRFCDGRPHRISGVIETLAKVYPHKTRYTLNCTGINGSPASGRVILTVPHETSRPPPAPALCVGEHIVVTAKIRAIRNFANPGGYDYQFRMQLKGIFGSIYARPHTITRTGRVERTVVSRFMRCVQRIRNCFSAAVERAAQGSGTLHRRPPDGFRSQAGAVLTALVTGQKGMIDATTRDDFSKAGLSHILAVSGLHISLVGLGFFYLFLSVLNWWPSLVIPGHARKLAGMLTLLPLTAYAGLTGFSPSTQRALLMAAVFLTASLVEREKDALNTLYLAGILILLIDPGALFAISFQLSFTSVFFIIAGFMWIENRLGLPGNRWLKWVCSMMLTTLFAGVGAAPVTAFYFNIISMSQVAGNLVMVPLIGFLCLPLGLSGLMLMPVALLPGLSHTLLSLGVAILSYCLGCIHWICGFEWTWARVVTPRPVDMAICYALLLCLGVALMEKRKGAMYLTLLLTAAGIASTGQGVLKRFYPGKLVVHTLDVGQGNAAVVITPDGKTLLIDAGGFGAYSSFDTGRYIVGPFLWRHWILSLDAVILTHPDSDHAGGLDFIFKNFRVMQWIKNQDCATSAAFTRLMRTAEKKGIRIRVPGHDADFAPDPGSGFDPAPWQFSWDQVKINILARKGAGPADDRNNNSLVTRLEFLSFSILFAGDIEKKRETELVQHADALKFTLESDVLMAPHHGSCSSSSSPFLDKVNPSGVIISCGYMNSYRFPCQRVLQRYRKRRIPIFRTDLTGAVTLQSDGAGYTIKTHRKR